MLLWLHEAWAGPVLGAGEVRIDVASGKVFIGDAQLKDGDMITIDGGVGEIYQGEIAKIQPRLSGAFEVLMGWADSLRRMKVRTNAETRQMPAWPEFGAEGIGLCRTEHMFFDADRIVTMREMIMASDSAGRQAALERLLPMQRQDFIELFEIMSGLPVTIRLLDPPLHEFLPIQIQSWKMWPRHQAYPLKQLGNGLTTERINLMLGHRGCRLAVTYPEICAMQARAIFEAAVHVAKSSAAPIPEVMIPLAATAAEISICRKIIDEVAADVFATAGRCLLYGGNHD